MLTCFIDVIFSLQWNHDKNQESSGNSQDEDDDEDDSGKASGDISAPIKMDEDPRGEPVVAKMVHQPIKFNDAPGKNVKIVKQKKVVKDAKPKVEKKKVSTKVNNDKAEKNAKHVKKVLKS